MVPVARLCLLLCSLRSLLQSPRVCMQRARQCLVVGKRVAKRAEERPGIGHRLLGIHEALPLRHSPKISVVVGKKIGRWSDADMHTNR